MVLVNVEDLKILVAVESKGEIRYGKLVTDLFDDIPTVEAIPVEWIEQYLDIQYPIESPYGTKSYFHDFMTRMIKEWRKENAIDS